MISSASRQFLQFMRQFEKPLMSNGLNQQWKDHLASTEYLRQGIGLRGYVQKQPIQEFIRGSCGMFTDLLDMITRGHPYPGPWVRAEDGRGRLGHSAALQRRRSLKPTVTKTARSAAMYPSLAVVS
jgi:preprotein translocase subunit SecA